ncbi:MAG: hypothetical protein FWE16_00415 [Firmicutes bacterium]|nr:hypothetical protein [Bacillota bacterium]
METIILFKEDNKDMMKRLLMLAVLFSLVTVGLLILIVVLDSNIFLFIGFILSFMIAIRFFIYRFNSKHLHSMFMITEHAFIFYSPISQSRKFNVHEFKGYEIINQKYKLVYFKLYFNENEFYISTRKSGELARILDVIIEHNEDNYETEAMH